MNIVKNFTTTHLRLNQIDLLEVLITFNDLSNEVCAPNKTEDLNVSVCNMITVIHDSKILTKHISCKCKCKFDEQNVIQINGGITINVDVSVKNVMYVKKKIYIQNPSTCSCENKKYLASIMDDSAITCDELKNHRRRNKHYSKHHQILMKRKQYVKWKMSIFYFYFY